MSKPKILIVLHEYIQDLGGLINWTESLIHGFKVLGCESKLIRVENKSSFHAVTMQHPRKREVGYAGYYLDQKVGWIFPTHARVPFLSTDWNKYTKDYDMLIWLAPVPTKTSTIYQDGDWQRLYSTVNKRTTQIICIHDGNLHRLYPHALEVIKYCHALTAVHDSAMGSLKLIKTKIPKLIIPSAQIARFAKVNFQNRKNQVFSVQTWKHWKHVGDLVRAIPYIKPKVILGGAGIHYYWMSGKKRREPYGHIWEDALEAGMKYVGWLTVSERDEILKTSKLLVDPSWSKQYAKLGSHFNRVFCDAAMMGCLPASTDMLMQNNSFFDPSDYITLPWNASPQEYAECINQAVRMDEKSYTTKVKNLQSVVRKKFDSVHCAKEYLKLIS